MKIGWRGLFCSILLYCLAESRERFWPLNDRRASEGDSLVDIVSKVLLTSSMCDVVLMTRDQSSDGWANDILDKISAATIGRAPTVYLNGREPEFPVFWLAPRDLIVYIYVSQREPDTVESELIADLTTFLHMDSQSRVLMLMILGQPSLDFRAFFQAIWSKRILNVIVAKYCRQPNESTTIHRYDPFTDNLTREPYSANITGWFIKDLPNMQGYPFVYTYASRPPYSDVVLTSTGELKQKGVDLKIIQTFADKMNFSGVFKTLQTTLYYDPLPNGTFTGIIPDLVDGKYEALLNTLPMFMDPYAQFTETIHVETWCFAVPRTPAQHDFFKFHRTGIRLFVISFLIVTVFWIIARLMRFDRNRWHPLKIIGIILTSSYPRTPTRLHEQIVYFSIFVTCIRYSSSLFGELTSLTIENNHDTQFDCLCDLIRSPLKLIVYNQHLDIVMQDDMLLNNNVKDIDKKVEITLNMSNCLETLLLHQNVSCFMEQGWANLAAVTNMRDGESILRVTKLCYLWMPTGYIFRRGSPYIRRISDLLLMLRESGIRDKWQRDYLRNETKDMNDDRVVNRRWMDFKSVGVFWPLIYVMRCGYFLSMLVFFGELIWKYIHLNVSFGRHIQRHM